MFSMDAAVQQLSEFSSLSKTAVTTASPAPVQPTAVQKACHALSSLQQLLVAIGSGENAGGDQLGGALAALEGVAVVMQSTHDQTVLKQSLVLIQAVAPCRVFQPSIVRHCWPIIWQVGLANPQSPHFSIFGLLTLQFSVTLLHNLAFFSLISLHSPQFSIFSLLTP